MSAVGATFMQAPSSPFHRLSGQWSGLLLALLPLAVAGALLILYGSAALRWQQQPFLGFFPLRNLEIDSSESLIGADWPALDAGLAEGDRLIALDGVDLDALAPGERVSAFTDALRARSEGDTVAVTFLRDGDAAPEGATCAPLPDTNGLQRCTLSLALGGMPTGDFASYFGVGWITALVLWLATVVLVLRHPRDVQVHTVALIAAAVAVFLAGRFDTLTTHRYAWVWLVTTNLLAGLLVMFALEFPYRLAAVQRAPVWRFAPVIAGLGVGGTAAGLYFSSDASLNRASFTLSIGVLLLGSLIVSGVMLWRRTRSASPVVRNQSTIVLIGLLPAIIPMLIAFGWQGVTGEGLNNLIVFNQVLPVLFPLSAIYAVSQFRLVDTDRMITQSVLYAALLGLLTLSYWLVVTGVAMLIGRSTRDTALSPALIVASIFVVAMVFYPVRAALQRVIDAVYFRTRRAYQTYLEQFSREVTHAVSLSDVTSLIARSLEDTLAPTHVIVFVRDNVTYEYRPQVDPATGAPPTDITFAPESGLVHYLSERSSLLYLEEGRPLPLDVVSDRSRLAVLGAPVIVGLQGQRVLNGFMVIGPRRNNAPYLHEDLRFIESLSDQVALAVERAQAIDDLERRVRVQDVLSQVSRALNFAIDFDTLLELIYAQTIRVIDVPNFYIALRNPNVDELIYVFYNEGDERIAPMEGKRWRMGRDLMSEIVRTRQTVRTDDFARDSLARDPRVKLDNPNLKAWMGVPLLADTGGGVLGVMVAATTEPNVTFNDDQLDLFWDIANLASSAIDKLQLFDKTQQRARQLSAINEIANQLASEMGNVDRLLHLITENAVQILGAEAGSLLLVDEDTGHLEFHVVVGGGGQDLIGTRIPAGSGLAGATVERGTPIIVNDPSRDARWYGDLDGPDDLVAALDQGERYDLASDDAALDDAGFQSRAILSVPLMIGGRAIGVLQTINKADGSIFIDEDADLLETFAGQAAVAIENARLFDMTDQQLALRVQELDTMQRIDHELNRTLNLTSVVEITMDWALRKSGAEAGILAILDREQGELRIVASYGYQPGSPFGRRDDPAQMVYPTDRGIVGLGDPQRAAVADHGRVDRSGLRRNARGLRRPAHRAAVQRQPRDRRDRAGERPRGPARPAGPGLRRPPGRARQPGHRQRPVVPGASAGQPGQERVRQLRGPRPEKPDDQYERLHRPAAEGRGRAGQRAAVRLPEHDPQQRHAHGNPGERPERPHQAGNGQHAARHRAGGLPRGDRRNRPGPAAPDRRERAGAGHPGAVRPAGGPGRSNAPDPDHDQLRLQREQVHAARRADHHHRRGRAQHLGPARPAPGDSLRRAGHGHRHERGRPEPAFRALFPQRQPENARAARHRPGADHHPRPDRAARGPSVGRERAGGRHDLPFHAAGRRRNGARARSSVSGNAVLGAQPHADGL